MKLQWRHVWWVGVFLMGLGVGVMGGGIYRESTKQAGQGVEYVAHEEAVLAAVDEETPTPQAIQAVTLRAVGDVMLGRTVNTKMLEYDDVRWPFEAIQEWLSESDLTVGNLESPLIHDCPARDTGMIFCGRAEVAEGLSWAGFDVLSISNNHAFNQGVAGRAATVEILEREGILAASESGVVIQEIQGKRLGLVAYNDVGGLLVEENIRRAVVDAAAEVDVLAAVVHWGAEYTHEPSERQRRLGRAMVEAGADLVLGAHPHWTQPVEQYESGVIFYSLGNFVFDQMWSEETRRGEVADIKLVFEGEELADIEYELLPVRIFDYGQPRLVEGSE